MRKRLPKHFRGTLPRAGTALVLTLFFILLISALVIALIVSMRLDRSSTQNYYQSARVQELANGALEEILSDLRSEIAAGSRSNAAFLVNGTQLYVPTTNRSAQPARIGFVTGTNGDYATDVDTNRIPPTLIRVSRAAVDINAVYPSTIYDQSKLPPLRASAVSSTNYSANSRTISPKRWNTSYLLSGTTTPPSRFASNAPDWVYVTRGGSRIVTDADISVLRASQNLDDTNNLVGRYAYIVYDAGGLIDVNCAGYPSTLLAATNAAVRGKSSIVYSALASLPGLTNNPTLIDDLIKWRSAGSIGTFNATNFIKASTNWVQRGFLSATNGDSPLLSRRDLIDYFTKKIGDTRALPYLGIFSRSVIAPSARPATPIGAASGYDYDAKADTVETGTSGIANRDLANVRFAQDSTVKHYSDDATATPKTYSVKTGDPLLQSRFSLARIGWLEKYANPDTGSGPSETSDEGKAIRECFGLKWGTPGVGNANGGNKCWIYAGSSAGSAFDGTIKTLAQAAEEGREPNFFELLKAAILSGSLAKYPGPAAFKNGTRTVTDDAPYLGPVYKDEYYYPFFSDANKFGTMGMYSHSFPSEKAATIEGNLPNIPVPSQVSDLQIIRIGANIIDQYDADSWPTAIYFKYKNIGTYDPAESSGNPIFGPVTMAYGTENLPYLQGLRQVAAYPDPTVQSIGAWRQPILWNPHQEPSSDHPFTRPQNYEIRAYGTGRTFWERAVEIPDPSYSDPTITYLNGMSQSVDYFTMPGLDTPESQSRGTIQFTMAPSSKAFYDKPYPLLQDGLDGVAATSPFAGNLGTSKMANFDDPMQIYGLKNHFVGFSTGFTDPLENPISNKNKSPYGPIYPGAGKGLSAAARGGGNGGVTTYVLGWRDSGGNFHPYSYIIGTFAYGSFKMRSYEQFGTAFPYADDCDAWIVPDPRTDRFSYGKTLFGGFEQSMSVYQRSGFGWYPCATPIFNGPNPNRLGFFGQGENGPPYNYTYPWGDLMVNSATDPQNANLETGSGHPKGYYTDRDGVVRPGDGFYGNPATGDGLMTFFTTGNPSGTPVSTEDSSSGSVGTHGRRPVILNRPFQSVAELGYTFRDQPFKTLDFFTDKSADTALLDVFTLRDAVTVNPDKLLPVTAGRINPNAASAPVLAAIMKGAAKKESDKTYSLSTEANAIATGVIQKILQSGDYAPVDGYRGLVPALVQAARAQTATTSSTDKANKAYLEAPLRGLSESTDFRTWNLMIDLICQSGQLTPTAKSLKDFAVQAECRVWLHVAIDRFTGKVIARQLEPVYE